MPALEVEGVEGVQANRGKGIYSDGFQNVNPQIMGMLNKLSANYIKQKGTKRECIELLTGCEMENRFEVYDREGGRSFMHMREDSNCCIRQCCTMCHPFQMDITNTEKNELYFRINRPFRCSDSWGCWPCYCLCGCTQEFTLEDPQGNIIATVREEPCTTYWQGYFTAYDSQGEPQLQMEVCCCDFCSMCLCQDVTFDFKDMSGEVVGTLTRQWKCNCGTVVADKDHFNVVWKNQNVNVQTKVYGFLMAMAAKYIYFEKGD